MAKFIFTPWKHHTDLLAVRSQFYPNPENDGPDMRAQACATVGAWKLRGTLPHPVEATALLTDAILHDDARKNSVFSIRATYAAAFCRFVTGLVDSKLYAGQRKTMFARAIELGLPASFVELRHEATHRELPSLTVLRSSTQRSLEWLWGFYWGRIDAVPMAASEPGEGGVFASELSLEGGYDVERALRKSFKGILEQATAVIEGNETDGAEPPRKRRKRVQTKLSGVTEQVVSVLKAETEGSKVLAEVLLRDGALIPRGRKLGESLTDAIENWDALLLTITEGHTAFLTTLAETMTEELAFTISSDPKKDAYCEGVYTWLDHILQSTRWESHKRTVSTSYIVAVCKESSNHWTALLKKTSSLEENGLPELTQRQKTATNQSSVAETIADTDEDLKMLSKHGWVNWIAIYSPETANLTPYDSNKLTSPISNNSPMSFARAIRPFSKVLTVNSPIPRVKARAMHIQSLPMWTGKGNNYAYLVTDEPTRQSVIIDPANPPEVVPELESQTKAEKINLTAIVNTHHHWDHAGGNNEVLKTFQVPVIGGKECQSVTRTPAHGEVFKIGDRISVTALHTPCHTQDSICYFMQDGEDKAVFTGDTLFIGGCGRFFEGTAPEMHKALNETLASLPDDTKVYPGHEYTKSNVKFCLSVSQTEPIKKLEAFAESNKETQGKFTIGDEKLHNVFMRVMDPEIQKKTGKTDPVEVMAALREMKNAM
ncbi:beta-lactamase-like protein [Aspergillus heterothallicus]